MRNLPEDLNNRFILYLNILPEVVKIMTYGLFCVGVLFLLASMSRVLFLNWDLQKKSADMDFSHGNSRELKRIHMSKMKTNENITSNGKIKEAEAYYSALLTSPQAAEGLDRETALLDIDLQGDRPASQVKDAVDNVSCNTTDTIETPPPQYDFLTFLSLKEDIV